MDSKYSLNEKVSKYLDGEKNSVRYIKKKTFEQAVDDGELINKTAGKTSLKQVSDKDNDKRYLVVSDDEQYVISKCPFSRLIGYIPVENDSFIEYRRFNFLLLILLGLMLAAVTVVSLNWNRWVGNNTPVVSQPIGGIGYEVGQTNKPTDPNTPTAEPISFPSITMPGYSEIKIPANTTNINTISLYNPSQNEGWYDLTFQIYVDTNNDGEYELIYESGKVAAGYRIDGFEINQPLNAGTYNAKMMFHAYYVEDDTIPLNNGAITVPLVVE